MYHLFGMRLIAWRNTCINCLLPSPTFLDVGKIFYFLIFLFKTFSLVTACYADTRKVDIFKKAYSSAIAECSRKCSVEFFQFYDVQRYSKIPILLLFIITDYSKQSYYYILFQCSLGKAVRRNLPSILLACGLLKAFSSQEGSKIRNSTLEERDRVTKTNGRCSLNT